MDTERAIGTKPIAAGDARTAVLERPETLWQAITDGTHLRSWFIEPRGDLRLGGTFALEGRAHGLICAATRRGCCASPGCTGHGTPTRSRSG
jgi:Activator of Hsp90 ATPase homolog 1-like protein